MKIGAKRNMRPEGLRNHPDVEVHQELDGARRSTAKQQDDAPSHQ